MKIIEQSHEILHLDGIDRIEIAGRTCYKSEDKIGCACPEKNGVFSGCPNDNPQCEPNDVEDGHCGHCDRSTAAKFIKMLIKRKHFAMLEHGGATVRFVTNRGVTHELVRHRLASFGHESTRFVSYGGKDIEFINPSWDMGQGGLEWLDAMRVADEKYNKLLSLGWAPEQAREVLPNSLATTIIVTANYREWRHIMELRAIGTTGRPHPQMKALMMPLLEEFKQRVPGVFDDL